MRSVFEHFFFVPNVWSIINVCVLKQYAKKTQATIINYNGNYFSCLKVKKILNNYHPFDQIFSHGLNLNWNLFYLNIHYLMISLLCVCVCVWYVKFGKFRNISNGNRNLKVETFMHDFWLIGCINKKKTLISSLSNLFHEFK